MFDHELVNGQLVEVHRGREMFIRMLIRAIEGWEKEEIIADEISHLIPDTTEDDEETSVV